MLTSTTKGSVGQRRQTFAQQQEAQAGQGARIAAEALPRRLGIGGRLPGRARCRAVPRHGDRRQRFAEGWALGDERGGSGLPDAGCCVHADEIPQRQGIGDGESVPRREFLGSIALPGDREERRAPAQPGERGCERGHRREQQRP